MKKAYSIVEWDNVKTNEDIMLIFKAIHGTVGFSEENPLYGELKDSGMLGEEQLIDVPDNPDTGQKITG